jgi:hypothetical protein
MSYVADLLVEDWLDLLCSKNTYVGLHYAVPPLVDPTSTELTGGAYSRQKAVMTQDSVNLRSAENTEVLRWTSLESTTVSHIAVYDGPYTSNLLFYVALQNMISVPVNGTFEIEMGDLYLRLP